tara:strand:+ start:309 stop:617 length:309 start_codon:yes stop_codon:yes gene_type:complete
MILKKLFISLSFVLFLNSCAQNAAFLGPAITGVSTGSLYQAGLSYGSTEAVKKITGKTPTENIKKLLTGSNKAEEAKTSDEFFMLVKSRIEKNSKIIDLAKQ